MTKPVGITVALLFCAAFLSISEGTPKSELRFPGGTKIQGVSTGALRTAEAHGDDDIHLDEFSSSSSSSSVTTKTTQKNPIQPQVVSFQVPAEAFLVGSQTGSSAVLTSTSSEAIHGSSTSAGVIANPVVTFIRPAGAFPIPPDRFGFDEPAPFGPNTAPNCVCVTKGACLPKVMAFTNLVLPYSDVRCGYPFEICCFDGPWPGVYDSFAAAAPCIPRAQCSRPYGVLPTDVRDFGAIAPCPGHGVVRCIMVDKAGLLEFQAAVAVSEATNFHNSRFYHSHPISFMVPILSEDGDEEENTIQSTLTSHASVLTSHSDQANVHPNSFLVQTPTVVGPVPNVVVPTPTVVGPAPIVVAPAPTVVVPAPNVVVTSSTGVVTSSTGVVTSSTGVVTPSAGVVTSSTGVVPVPAAVIPIPSPVVPAPAAVIPLPSPVFSVPSDIVPISNPLFPVATSVDPISSPAVPVPITVVPAPPLIPAMPSLVPVPWSSVGFPVPMTRIPSSPAIFPTQPGFGFGKGFGFKKRISFSKGIGFGGGIFPFYGR